MKTFDIILPNNSTASKPKSKNSFRWTDMHKEVIANQCSIEQRENSTGKILYLVGSNGALSDGTYIAYQMYVPLPNEDLKDKKFTSADTLKVHHLHVTEVTPEHIYLRMVEADAASLILSLDWNKGTSSGTFKADFTTGYDLHPEGEFEMTLELRVKD